jgi:hypothetical protein
MTLPEARQLVLGEGLITLKARLIGVKDGQLLIGQHLRLLQLRDTGQLRGGTRGRR